MPIGLRRKLAVVWALAGLLLVGASISTARTLEGASIPARHAPAVSAAKRAKHARSGRAHARRHHVRHRRRIGPGAPPSAGSEGSSTTVTGLIPSGPGTVEAAGKASGAGGGSGSGGGTGAGGGESKASGGGASASGDPFAGQAFYVEPRSNAKRTEEEWAAQGRAAEAAAIAKIASHAVAKWFGDWTYGHGGTQGDVNWWVGQATAAGALPVLVAYDLPWRDCSGYSGGGAASPSAYREFVNGMAAGIGSRRAVVILEPDALAELSCLSAEQQSAYYSLLSYAVSTLGAHAGVAVYLDAGHAGWQSAATMAARLRLAGVSGARGFSLNVSNFDATGSEVSYGEAISRGIASQPAPSQPAPSASHFVVDTSRNGRGLAPGGAWCNPPGRGLGTPPTAATGNAAVDAYLWVKGPGQSDGTCNGGPSAGSWWASYALELAVNASF
jgi:endoglucanase